MPTFGEALRAFRQSSNDPDRLNKRLTQERLGELIGDDLGDMGYSGAAVSDWERGESKINAQDRNVLTALIRVFQRCGSLKTIAEADEFLKCGNYRALDEEEARKIFGELPNGLNSKQPVFREENPVNGRFLSFTDMFSISKGELDEILVKAEDGPSPFWPRILAELIRKATERFTLSFHAILWIVVWLLAFLLIGPSLRLPFGDHNAAEWAMSLYVAGSLIIPLLIGMLVNTKDSEYWQQLAGLRPLLLRLYTYQGAGIGFNIGYFLVFPLGLARHYLGLESTIWIEVLAATVGLVLGSTGSRVVPHNLWRAYRRHNLKDGGVFFVVALMGPLWGWFFLEYYTILLTPLLGIAVILLALALVVLIARQSSKKQAA